MDVDINQFVSTSNVDDWLACFSPLAGSKSDAFPFTQHKVQSIESRRARMSDLLIFDVLLIRGGIRSPDMLFPPVDWVALRNLLQVMDDSVYDILKKDCLVYMLLKWAWETDTNEVNPGWDTRYIQDRCIPPQFVALADAYWLLDTGTQLAKAVSILSDARLNRDYVSKILQALALPSFFISSDGNTANPALVVKYVRTAKPLLTEPDDINLYALSLVQLSFMDAWAYQKSFPEGSNTRERLLGKLVGWSLTPTPKQAPLAQLLAIPLSPYEESFIHGLALPPHFSSMSSGNMASAFATEFVLPLQARLILQDLLCVRAIQSGDYVHAIKLDRQFSSVSPSSAAGAPSTLPQVTFSGRDAIDRKSIIQELFTALPPAERTLLEDEIGMVATGVRANASTPRQANLAVRGPLIPEPSLSASWEDVGATTTSPAPSHSVPLAVGTGFTAKVTPPPIPPIGRVTQSPFSASTAMPRPQQVSNRQAPPVPKFTAFGSPIPSASRGRGIITERGKTFSTGAAGGLGILAKSATHVSLFDTAGSAKNAPNAFYKPPSSLAKISLDVGSTPASTSIAKPAGQDTDAAKRNGKASQGDSDGEDVSMESGSEIAIIEDDHHSESGGEEEEEDAFEETEETENFITADATMHTRNVDDAMDEDDAPELGFSVFSGYGGSVHNGNASGYEKKESVSPYSSPPHASVSPSREADTSLSLSVASTRSRQRAPPGAFHHEDEEEEEEDREEGEEEEDEEDDRASQITPISTPRRSTRTHMQSQTPSRPPTRSQPQPSPKSIPTSMGATSRMLTRAGKTSGRNIPGSLMDEDEDEEHPSDAHSDDNTEPDEQEEEEDALAPLPSRSTRRTRSSGFVGMTTTTSAKSKSSTKSAAKTGTGSESAKGKAKARPSEVQTPARRSSRLSMASSTSPDYHEVASPTKVGRRSTGPRAPVGASASLGSVVTRSSSRRKR